MKATSSVAVNDTKETALMSRYTARSWSVEGGTWEGGTGRVKEWGTATLPTP